MQSNVSFCPKKRTEKNPTKFKTLQHLTGSESIAAYFTAVCVSTVYKAGRCSLPVRRCACQRTKGQWWFPTIQNH